jgi:putative hydrolase of the HAD superfamily
MTVKAVFFDMGGTIDTNWYSNEMRLSVTPDLQQVLISKGLHLNLTDKQLLDVITDGLARYHQWRLASLEELSPYVVWHDFILADIPYSCPELAHIAEDLMVWIETHYYQRTMRPEMPAVLNEIHSLGLKIGLISNVNSRGQVPLNLEQYGLKHYFSPIVLSSEYKRRKPDPAIFHYAARLANSPTTECIHVGDRISRDILGAKRAGFRRAIQITHDFKHGEIDGGAVPDLIIDNMNELVDYLKNEIASSNEPRPLPAPGSPVRAVFFDADGVLYYRDNKDNGLQAFIKQYGCSPLNTRDKTFTSLRRQAYIGKITFEEYLTKILNNYRINDPKLVATGIDHIIQEKDQIKFFPETLPTLLSLKNQEFYLGIITDTALPLYVKLDKLERGGIGHLWDAITPSNEVGTQKPDPKIYRLALDQIGIHANQAAFVGHKASELDGAKRVGMYTIAFNYDRNAKADFYIDRFSELTNLSILN